MPAMWNLTKHDGGKTEKSVEGFDWLQITLEDT